MNDDHNNGHAAAPPRSVGAAAGSRIRVMPLDERLRPAVRELAVRPEQRPYVGHVADLLADVDRCPGAEPMVICSGATPVGYYRVDPHARSVAGRDFNLPSRGLRAFFLDARWQGRGLASSALVALIADLTERHPQTLQLVLTVNVCNHVAVGLYLRGGFRDSGELYQGGKAGPQHLLLCRLQPAPR